MSLMMRVGRRTVGPEMIAGRGRIRVTRVGRCFREDSVSEFAQRTGATETEGVGGLFGRADSENAFTR